MKTLYRFMWIAAVLFMVPQSVHGRFEKPLEFASGSSQAGSGRTPGAVEAGPSSGPRNLWYQTIGLADGLSQGFVGAMAQDRDGYIWLATTDGLNRYDGRRFDVFRHSPADPTTLSAGAIYALHVDAAGRLWVGTESGLDRWDPSTNSFARYHHDLQDSAALPGGPVELIDTDQAGHVWFASNSLSCLDPDSGQIQVYPVDPAAGWNFTSIKVDSRNRLWVAKAAIDTQTDQETGEYRLDVFDLGEKCATERLLKPRIRLRPEVDQGKYTTILEDAFGKIWIGSERGGLIRFDPESRQESFVRLPGDSLSGHRGQNIRSLAQDPDAGIWALAGFDNRLFYIDPVSLKARPVTLRSQSTQRIDEADFQRLFIDQSGVLWIGLSVGGVVSSDISSRGVDLYRLSSGSPGSNFIRAIYRDRDGSIWVGTPRGVRQIEHEAANTATAAALAKASLDNLDVQAIHRDRLGRFWIGTARGLVRIDSDTGAKTTLIPHPDNPGGLDVAKIDVIHEDAGGALWFGTGNRGLLAILEKDGPIVRFRHDPNDPDSLPSNSIRAIFSDQVGRLWVGTAKGLVKAEPGPAGHLRFRHIFFDDPTRDRGNMFAITERTQEPGVLWLGWAGLGLTRLEVDTGVARHWTTHDSQLPNDTLYAILPDDRGQLWMSTNNGLASFDPNGDSFRTYGLELLLQSLEFNHRAAFRASDGKLFFGGIAGLNAFYPDRILRNPFPPKVHVNRVLLMDRGNTEPTVPFVPRFNIYRRGQDLVLEPRERDLRFEFAGLHFANPDLNRFSYRLDPFDSGWRDPVKEGNATYTNLAPGQYSFRVRAVSSHGVWGDTEDQVNFTIRAPFYQTTWFLGLGLFFLGMTFLGAHKWRLLMLRRRAALLEREVDERTDELISTLKLVEKQSRRLKELDEAKSRFFANISHELRTPLTLTLGPLEDLKRGRHGALSGEALLDVELALRNTHQQLELVDQLLTLTALKSCAVVLAPRRARLDDLARAVASRFLPHAESLGLQLQVELPLEPVWYVFDEEKIDQVISNLLSNACKYNSPKGQITLRMNSRPEVIVIQVEDTGIGISKEERGRVFERFYRAGSEHSGRPGTGIGLALVRELVELHGGRVRVESLPGKGSIFVVELPRPPGQVPHGKPHPEAPAASSSPDKTMAEPCSMEGDLDSEADRPTILVVEDHPDMLALLRRQLSDQYSVIEAEDARTGLALAAENVPDLVISDVMMDGMDGFDFCAALRDDPELAHLPVLLLTARADKESRLKGLGRGADDYLVKPFDRQELLLRLRNLLQSRLRLREKLLLESRDQQHSVGPHVSAGPAFQDRLRHILESRAFEDSFSVSDLATGLAMSRAKLYRQVAEVYESTPSQLILEFRLERSAELLRAHAGNVSEIAYAVGFKNVSHFIRRFREHFGTTPTSYAGEPATQQSSPHERQ